MKIRTILSNIREFFWPLLEPLEEPEIQQINIEDCKVDDKDMDLVLEYLKEDESNHVLYRVTPIYKNDNLVASGVQMEAISIKDLGKSICFNVYLYNVQPGINIDYKTGNSSIL